MGAMSPLPRRPTIGDLALSLTQLHGCVEEARTVQIKHKEDTQANFDRINYLFGIKDVPTDKLVNMRPRAQVSYKRMFVTFIASIAAVSGCYKFAVFVWPAIKLLLIASLDGFK